MLPSGKKEKNKQVHVGENKKTVYWFKTHCIKCITDISLLRSIESYHEWNG